VRGTPILRRGPLAPNRPVHRCEGFRSAKSSRRRLAPAAAASRSPIRTLLVPRRSMPRAEEGPKGSLTGGVSAPEVCASSQRHAVDRMRAKRARPRLRPERNAFVAAPEGRTTRASAHTVERRDMDVPRVLRREGAPWGNRGKRPAVTGPRKEEDVGDPRDVPGVVLSRHRAVGVAPGSSGTHRGRGASSRGSHHSLVQALSVTLVSATERRALSPFGEARSAPQPAGPPARGKRSPKTTAVVGASHRRLRPLGTPLGHLMSRGIPASRNQVFSGVPHRVLGNPARREAGRPDGRAGGRAYPRLRSEPP
jgi:hypothetical protein